MSADFINSPVSAINLGESFAQTDSPKQEYAKYRKLMNFYAVKRPHDPMGQWASQFYIECKDIVMNMRARGIGCV